MFGLREHVASLRAEIAEIQNEICQERLDPERGNLNVREAEQLRREQRLRQILDELKALLTGEAPER